MNTPGAFSQLANKTHSETSLCLGSQEPSPVSGRIWFLTTSVILSMRVPAVLRGEEHLAELFYHGPLLKLLAFYFQFGFQHLFMCFFIITQNVWLRDRFRVFVWNVHRGVVAHCCPLTDVKASHTWQL